MQERKLVRLKKGSILIDEAGNVISFSTGNMYFSRDDICKCSKQAIISFLQEQIDDLNVEISDLRKIKDYVNDSFNNPLEVE